MMLADDGARGPVNPLVSRTQRELMAFIASSDNTALGRTEKMWRDTAASARDIAGLIRTRLEKLVGPHGWQGAGAEAYKTGVAREMITQLEKYATSAEKHADELKPINQTVNDAYTSAELNDIPWDRETKWHVKREEVDQSLWGKIDEAVTGTDEGYEKAKDEAPYLVVDGFAAEKRSVEHTQWETLLKTHPQLKHSPQIFTDTGTGVTPDVHRFDELMEAIGMNRVQHNVLSSHANDVREAFDKYAPAASYSDAAQGALKSGLDAGAAGGAGGAAAQGTSTAELATGPGGIGAGNPGGSNPGGLGGGNPGGPGQGGTGPGSSGPISAGPISAGPISAGPIGTGPIGAGPIGGGPGKGGPGRGEGGPLVPGPIGGGPASPIHGPIGGGSTPGDGDPADVSKNLPAGTETAGLDDTPGAAARLSNVGAGVLGPGLGAGASGGAQPLGGTLTPGGIGGVGGAGGLPGAGGGMGAPRGGVSFSMGPGGRPMVNPGSVGPLAGPGGPGTAGAGSPMGAMPMGAGRGGRSDKDEKSYEYNSWLEEDEEVWTESAKDSPKS